MKYILNLTMSFLLPTAQNILLYQRLTKVMAKLAYGVEVEMQNHMEELELRLKKAGDAVQSLDPELERLRARLANIEDYVTHDLDHSVKRSSKSVNDGIHGAVQLQRLLSVMIQTVLDGASQVAAAQEKSVDIAGQREDEINNWLNVISTAATSAEILSSQIVRICNFDTRVTDTESQTRLTNRALHNRKYPASKSRPYRNSKKQFR